MGSKFAFILYDSSSKTTFVAADADGSVPFFWGTDAEGNIVLSDDVEIVKKGCCKSLAPFPKVTCIQFNPVDDRYFISGSLDAKVHIWSIPDRQVVDWNDLHEMVTAACYTSDGRCGGKFQPKPKVQIEREKPGADTSHLDAVESIPCPQQARSIPSEIEYMNEGSNLAFLSNNIVDFPSSKKYPIFFWMI